MNEQITRQYAEALRVGAEFQTWPGHFLFKAVETALLLRQVDISPDAVGLELGCGNGFQSMLLANRCRQLFATDLLDADPHTHTLGLATPQALLERCGVRNVALLPADACALPFPDAQFDFVISSSVLEHIERRSAALGEMSRVLKPGGQMIIAVPTHVASLCAFIHVPLYVGVRAIQVLNRKLRGGSVPVHERVTSARQVMEQDRARGLGATWRAFRRHHPTFPFPEPHGTYRSIFQELGAQFPGRWRALLEAGGFQIERSFALTLVPISLLEVFSPALMASVYQRSQGLHERAMGHPIAKSLAFIWAAVCRKAPAAAQISSPPMPHHVSVGA